MTNRKRPDKCKTELYYLTCLLVRDIDTDKGKEYAFFFITRLSADIISIYFNPSGLFEFSEINYELTFYLN